MPTTAQTQDKGSYLNASLLKLNQNGSRWNSSPSPLNPNPSRMLPDALHFTQTPVPKLSRTRGYWQTWRLNFRLKKCKKNWKIAKSNLLSFKFRWHYTNLEKKLRHLDLWKQTRSTATRARCSHANFMLNELETFLQERDSEDDLLNVDDEAKYQEFLAVVLSYVWDIDRWFIYLFHIINTPSTWWSAKFDLVCCSCS